MAYGVQSPVRIIKYRSSFVDKLNQFITRRDLHLIEGEVYSIDHKLNVARYCAGLLTEIKLDDYVQHFQLHEFEEDDPVIMEYDKCLRLYSYDEDQFFLSLLFCLETFAASTFSLFDTCGQMITKIYDLPLNEKERNYIKATEELNKKGLKNIYKFLNQYLTEGDTISWISPLRKIRHHTTHRNITDIINMQTRMPFQSFGNNVFLQEDFFRTDPNKSSDHLKKYEDLKNRELKVFACESFNGLEDFVEKLYKVIAVQVEKEKSIRLSGLYDELIDP